MELLRKEGDRYQARKRAYVLRQIREERKVSKAASEVAIIPVALSKSAEPWTEIAPPASMAQEEDR